MPRIEASRIANQLRRAIAGPAWHGPSLLEAIDGVTADQAAARPIAAAHSIHELAAHAVAWLDIVGQRLAGSPPAVTEAMNWPPVAPPDWAGMRRRIEDAAERLDAAVRALDDGRLPEEIPIDGDRWSVYETLHGVVQHALYHAGQIALLKRAV